MDMFQGLRGIDAPAVWDDAAYRVRGFMNTSWLSNSVGRTWLCGTSEKEFF